MATVYTFDELPVYFKDVLISVCLDLFDKENASHELKVLELTEIKTLDSPSLQYSHLLLRRHHLTQELARIGLNPHLIYLRARTYEALGYADLAAGDAFIVYTLCQSTRNEEWVSDLQAVQLNGEPWLPNQDEPPTIDMLCRSLAILCKALVRLGATEDAREMFDELTELAREFHDNSIEENDDLASITKAFLDDVCEETIWNQTPVWDSLHAEHRKFGSSRREIYPWNSYEPDRNSPESIMEINSLLLKIAPDVQAKVTALPALDENGSVSDGKWHQLGLFAVRDLQPGAEILREKSLLTAIRPLDDALCDACGADLESVPRDSMQQCSGIDCDITFCSQDCAVRAQSEYHIPNMAQSEDKEDASNSIDEEPEVDSDYPPPHAPFCGNSALQEIGRTSSTTTPEWDLYFLLLTRTIQTSTTQTTHPLSLPSTKFLWGDFNPAPPPTEPTSTITNPKRTLPWSLHHNLTLPLQYFETLMHSLPEMTPYSAHWLANFDWWVQSTLVAKFRGVANAQQSTFDGKPEIAAVHPCWCLANHSCAPNVSWTPAGERVFRVREHGELVGLGGEPRNWDGIKEGDEIWSHYTDVRLPVEERRERLMEVLGGVCKCERCLREEAES